MVAASARPLSGLFFRDPRRVLLAILRTAIFWPKGQNFRPRRSEARVRVPVRPFFMQIPGVEPATLEFPEKILPFGRAGRREREFDGWSSHGFGAKRALFSLDSFLTSFRLPGRVSNHFPKPSESDSYLIVSYLLRSAPTLTYALHLTVLTL